MGLLTGLILLPLAPVRGVAWLSEQVLDLATQEEYNPVETYQRLAELDEARDAGEISAEECAAAEEALVARLMRARGGMRGIPEADSD
ncbi:MAG TPA: gas vesicle protein GvpG [Streptosporangiaceae bacterium]